MAVFCGRYDVETPPTYYPGLRRAGGAAPSPCRSKISSKNSSSIAREPTTSPLYPELVAAYPSRSQLGGLRDQPRPSDVAADRHLRSGVPGVVGGPPQATSPSPIPRRPLRALLASCPQRSLAARKLQEG